MQFFVELILRFMHLLESFFHFIIVLFTRPLGLIIVDFLKVVEFPLPFVFAILEVSIPLVQVGNKFAFHPGLLLEPGLLFGDVALVAFIVVGILLTDLLVVHLSETGRVLSVLLFEGLNLREVILIVFVHKVVLCSDLFRVALFNLSAFVEPGITVSLVLIVSVVDILVLAADLLVMRLLITAGVSSVIVLQPLYFLGMILVQVVDKGLSLLELLVVLFDDALFVLLGILQVRMELVRSSVHVIKTVLHLPFMRLAI